MPVRRNSDARALQDLIVHSYRLPHTAGARDVLFCARALGPLRDLR